MVWSQQTSFTLTLMDCVWLKNDRVGWYLLCIWLNPYEVICIVCLLSAHEEHCRKSQTLCSSMCWSLSYIYSYNQRERAAAVLMPRVCACRWEFSSIQPHSSWWTEKVFTVSFIAVLSIACIAAKAAVGRPEPHSVGHLNFTWPFNKSCLLFISQWSLCGWMRRSNPRVGCDWIPWIPT